jgi:hypothetical protein
MNMNISRATIAAVSLRPLVIRVLGLAAIFAIAVLAGCSSPSLRTSTTSPAGHLTGTMTDWTSTVCERGSGPVPMAHGRMLGSAPNPMVCPGLMQTGSGTRMRVPISIGTYTSESLMGNDLSRVGAYAKGNDGTEYVVFAALSTLGPSLLAESAMLQPLRAYGFEVFPSPNPSVEPAPTQPLPGSTNAMPPPTVTPPASDNATSQYVRTESGRVRCVVQPDQVGCEASGLGSTGFLQAPISLPESQCKYSPCPGGIHSDLAEVTASGAFHWDDGNIGGVGSDWAQTDTTLGYGQTYHMSGWTVVPSSDGTRFTNDSTGGIFQGG